MQRLIRTLIVAALAGAYATGQASSQVRDRYDNSIDMSAPLSRQQRTIVDNAPRRNLPDNCYSNVATDRTVACIAPSAVTAPPAAVPSIPCTPKSELRNPALGPLPNTCP